MAKQTTAIGLPCLLLVVAALFCAPGAAYRCEETMDAYFQIMTAHNYSMLPSILNDSVVWTIPGSPNLLPFNGVFKGPAAVVRWAETISATLHMYYDGEYAQVSTNNQGHISFHDEGTVVRKNGRYYRVAVAHEWHFDDQCKVTIFNGYYDTLVAVLAYNNGVTYPVPIPATAAPVLGVEFVSTEAAQAVVQKFIDGDMSQLADNVTTFMPGNDQVFPFSGVFFSDTQLGQALDALNQVFQIISYQDTADMMVQNGAVATFREYVVQSVETGEKTTLPVCQHFQVNPDLKIQTYALYFDTYLLASISPPRRTTRRPGPVH